MNLSGEAGTSGSIAPTSPEELLFAIIDLSLAENYKDLRVVHNSCRMDPGSLSGQDVIAIALGTAGWAASKGMRVVSGDAELVGRGIGFGSLGFGLTMCSYPRHSRLDLRQLAQCGRISSHCSVIYTQSVNSALIY